MKNEVENFGGQIRNYLSPYNMLIGLVDEFVNGKMSETFFKNFYIKNQDYFKNNLENFIRLSKRSEMEELEY